jgi:hypothetical protein
MNGAKLSDAKLVRYYYCEKAPPKNPKKIKSVEFVTGAQMCHEHKVSGTTNFSLRRKMARNVLYKASLLSSEPGADPNIICASHARPEGRVGSRLEGHSRARANL